MQALSPWILCGLKHQCVVSLKQGLCLREALHLGDAAGGGGLTLWHSSSHGPIPNLTQVSAASSSLCFGALGGALYSLEQWFQGSESSAGTSGVISGEVLRD